MPEGPTEVSLILNNACFFQRQLMQIGTECSESIKSLLVACECRQGRARGTSSLL